jgi:hypothetical protein
MRTNLPTGDRVKKTFRLAWLTAWLTARPRGQWASDRGRWLRILLTAGLVVTGVSAWALALVQPWIGHSGSEVAVAAEIDAQKIRAVSADLVKLGNDDRGPLAPPPTRNPFVCEGASKGVTQKPAPAPAAVIPPKTVEVRTEPSGDARAMLEKIKALRLEATLLAPTGERWAVINGQNYREGEAVAGFRIIEIQENKVRLQQGGMTGLLRMD